MDIVKVTEPDIAPPSCWSARILCPVNKKTGYCSVHGPTSDYWNRIAAELGV